MRVGSTCSMDTAPSVSHSHFSPGFTVTSPRETASMMSLSGAEVEGRVEDLVVRVGADAEHPGVRGLGRLAERGGGRQAGGAGRQELAAGDRALLWHGRLLVARPYGWSPYHGRAGLP